MIEHETGRIQVSQMTVTPMMAPASSQLVQGPEPQVADAELPSRGGIKCEAESDEETPIANADIKIESQEPNDDDDEYIEIEKLAEYPAQSENAKIGESVDSNEDDTKQICMDNDGDGNEQGRRSLTPNLS